MREIKFRGLTISGEMVYGLLAQSHGLPRQPIAGFYISNRGGSPWAFEVRPETIGRFTGLHDREGKEIFEGDVVKIGAGYGGDYYYEEGIAEIIYDPPEFYPKNPHDKHGITCVENPWQDMIVIGNIHQNPELIECAR